MNHLSVNPTKWKTHSNNSSANYRGTMSVFDHGLKSNLVSCCRVRYRGVSRLCSDKKNIRSTFATNSKCLLNKTFYTSLVYKHKETK